MSAELSLFAAFLVGLSGGVHCIAMCGGISAALGFATAQQRTNNFVYALTYSTGRVISYSFIGLLFGGIAALLNKQSAALHQILQVLSSILLLGIGLNITGIFPRFSLLEKSGAKIWIYIQPIALKFFPVNSLKKAFGFGLFWGWLPCGLVYSTLAWSASSGSMMTSAGMMAAFGLGTFPWLLASTLAGQHLKQISALNAVKKALGAFLIAIACYGFVNSFTAHRTHHHTHADKLNSDAEQEHRHHH